MASPDGRSEVGRIAQGAISHQPAGLQDRRRIYGSMQSRLHLLAQQLHRAHDALVRDQASGVELGENAGEAKLISKAREIVGDNFRGADDRAAATCLLPSEVLQPLGALD